MKGDKNFWNRGLLGPRRSGRYQIQTFDKNSPHFNGSMTGLSLRRAFNNAGSKRVELLLAGLCDEVSNRHSLRKNCHFSLRYYLYSDTILRTVRAVSLLATVAIVTVDFGT